MAIVECACVLEDTNDAWPCATLPSCDPLYIAFKNNGLAVTSVLLDEESIDLPVSPPPCAQQLPFKAALRRFGRMPMSQAQGQQAEVQIDASERRVAHSGQMNCSYVKPTPVATDKKAETAFDSRVANMVVRQETAYLKVGMGGSFTSSDSIEGHAKDAEPSFWEPSHSLAVDTTSSQPQTTLMVRNVPVMYTQEMLVLEWPNNATYDFLYLPYSCSMQRNLSYCFINFTSERAAMAFKNHWQKRRLSQFSSRKPLNISIADVQGRECNLLELDKKRVKRIKVEQCQPLIFEDGRRVQLSAAIHNVAERLPEHGSPGVTELPEQPQQASDRTPSPFVFETIFL